MLSPGDIRSIVQPGTRLEGSTQASVAQAGLQAGDARRAVVVLDDRREPEYFLGGRRVSFVDKTLSCTDCGRAFTFTAGEQEFHQSKGFVTEPRRCTICRAARKATGSTVKRSSRELFTVTCASCGNPARVPFEPREGRPVYCSECFQSQPRSVASDFARRTRYGAFRGGRSDYDRSPQIQRSSGTRRSW
jgi:CxxC-x17-CxxC domain-containing protein